jgi:hypothetical protein
MVTVTGELITNADTKEYGLVLWLGTPDKAEAFPIGDALINGLKKLSRAVDVPQGTNKTGLETPGPRGSDTGPNSGEDVSDPKGEQSEKV